MKIKKDLAEYILKNLEAFKEILFLGFLEEEEEDNKKEPMGILAGIDINLEKL